MRTLQPEDLFRMTIARSPRVSPDGHSVLYLREQPDLMTDEVANSLYLLDRRTGAERRIDVPGNILFARWAAAGAILAIVADPADEGIINVMQTASDGGPLLTIAQLPFRPSQIDVSRDGLHLALLMKVTARSRMVSLPEQPVGANWAPRAKFIEQTVWRVDGMGEIDGQEQLFVVDLTSGTLRQITKTLVATPLFPSGIAFSADGSRLIFATNFSPDWERAQWDCAIHSVDIATGVIIPLTSGKGSDVDPQPSPDGRWIAYRGFDDTGQFHHAPSLRVMRSDGSEHRTLADLGQNIGRHAWSRNGDGLYISFVRDGAQHLGFVDLDGAVRELFSGLAAEGGLDVEPYLGGGAGFDVASDAVILAASMPGDPSQLMIVERSGVVRTLTRLNADWLPDIAVGTVKGIRFNAPDETPIQAWLIYPPGYDPEHPYPLIVNIHGGPNLAYGSHFSFRMQRYVAEGYVVLLVNYRGSAGADMTFYENPSTFPNDEYHDLMAGVDAAIREANIDPHRLFVTGLSAGGVLTAWTIGKTKRFAAAAVHSPITNWISHSLTNDLYSSYTDRSFASMPWDDPMEYWRRSPLSLVADVVTPTLVVQGEMDSRTPPGESLQFYHALRLLDVPTALVLLPGAFHIPHRPTQWIEEQEYILRWFAEHPCLARQSVLDAPAPIAERAH